jgi:hypothetical protein
MSCDIRGYIETRTFDFSTSWYAYVDIEAMTEENRTISAFLFGVKNTAVFLPRAAGRGIPADASHETKVRVSGESAFHPIWVALEELAAMNWNEWRTGPPTSSRRSPAAVLDSLAGTSYGSPHSKHERHSPRRQARTPLITPAPRVMCHHHLRPPAGSPQIGYRSAALPLAQRVQKYSNAWRSLLQDQFE